MELRQLQAFVAVATELHFGRAAERLFIAQSTLSELIVRLERELGTPLLSRTTRHVELTEAGSELLHRSRGVLDAVAEAATAVRRIGSGERGTVRLGITPPAVPALLPHLRATLSAVAPEVELVVSLLWLPLLEQALAEGAVDVGITVARLPPAPGMSTRVFCAQPLLVGVRPDHPLAGADAIRLTDLLSGVMGATSDTLFPAWALAQRQALEAAGVVPRSTPLLDPDLGAARWIEQHDVDWILLIGSLASGHSETVIRPVEPAQDVPFSVRWAPSRVRTPAVGRFVEHVMAVMPPSGWTSLREPEPEGRRQGATIPSR